MAYDSMQGMGFQKAVGKCVGESGSWREVMKRIADLIDPTCKPVETVEEREIFGVPSKCYRNACSACGGKVSAFYDSYCRHCGARIVLGDESDEHR